MKQITKLLIFFLITSALPIHAQPSVSKTHAYVAKKGASNEDNSQRPKKAFRKFQIMVTNEEKEKNIKANNDRLLALQATSRENSERGILGNLIKTAYSSSLVQKTVNASSNLLSLGVSYLEQAVKGNSDKWYRTAQQQCSYRQPLTSETKIDNFYALPSLKGALDPENMRFDGFGCRNFIKVEGTNEGVDVFYVFCKLRRDSVGLDHIVNHSKFLVEIDTLMFNPKYCNLPNDSTENIAGRFDFRKRDNLCLNIKVRIYSSWFNQAMMLADNQQLGEFTINVKVDKNKLNADSIFIYHKNDVAYDSLVSVEGDCFVVPRSYTGTIDAKNYQPTWGTGQYRVEMDVAETCRIVDSYYKVREAGNGREVARTEGTPGKIKWDKKKWQVEWKEMNTRRKSASVLENAWNCVVSAYKGSGWVATLTDPLATSLYSYETQKLNHLLNFDTQQNAQLAAAKQQATAAAAAAAAKTPTTPSNASSQGTPPASSQE